MSQKSITIQRPKAPSPDSWIKSETPTAAGRTKRLTLDIPEELHKRVRLACVERGAFVSDVVRDLLDKAFPATERKG